MKIAVTSRGDDLTAQVDPRFGRCAKFALIDTESMALEVIDNTNVSAAGGAGIQAAQAISDHSVTAVLTGNCGPNAFRALAAAGIEVITGMSGTVGDAVKSYQDGTATSSDAPNVTSHFGTTSV
ncbi:MAG: dinitrogenase iron-molybdenum cofactor biosynthesis protein [Lentisphaerae bacterium]|jgi:predicted Fe-Mo cluster-binding NifX family protein|nr:dinitrogenase iron-molybdenum cofactor biosynthesis protein [Lentisphaerota bacterium]MBT4823541.1 dinitrogenase iron-molybdenum cofactor biosynthesis protein [Lentisphaerota bacterium]MBT5612705.1 dinitrogenase iron-molybdenum cofactor biosynthesis protein [Lentisphaerota bacterium]MBT7060334.1 dinitrogenase iron-molybdenum cofactor biosynthesis protein [Lentisphaerota bacterium]MBT7845604.1 dinitrogenase iron-molybdenum cofactor biosynthesis protein [Lentisphaerota bacterium]